MEDLAVFQHQTFGHTLGFGRRSGLLSIDFQIGFSDPDDIGGYNINDAIANTAELLDYVRQSALPLFHARFVTLDHGLDLGTFGEKVPRMRDVTSDSPMSRFAPAVAPVAGEPVIEKRHASAFFGTTLADRLKALGVDTVFIAGCTTSGCVRASVVDASAHGFRPMVVAECVGDRARAPHEASLFDMAMKYADIVSLADARAHLLPGA